MNKCPYCGSYSGVYTTFTGTQYYKWNGDSNGYSDFTEKESKFARCISCNRRISMKRIQKESDIDK